MISKSLKEERRTGCVETHEDVYILLESPHVATRIMETWPLPGQTTKQTIGDPPREVRN